MAQINKYAEMTDEISEGEEKKELHHGMDMIKIEEVCQDEGMHQQQYLSWRKLLLSKAKLKASSSTSGLMSGFAMVAMVEINLDEELPSLLCIIFSAMTAILISVHVFALMISVCILPNIETVNNLYNSAYIQEECKISISPDDSPHNTLRVYIEVAWIFSTGVGSLLFLMEIPVLIWVKFYKASFAASIVCTAIMIPVCILFIIFSLRFYHKLIRHKQDKNVEAMEGLQLIVTQLNNDEYPDGSETPQINRIQII